METAKTVKIWARVGAYIEVDAQDFIENPEEALREAAKKGNMKGNGDCYVPQYTVHDELKRQKINIDEYPLIHDLIKEDDELNFDI